jgi:uncharacterized protein YutE (UPF0331/DUF86 family)
MSTAKLQILAKIKKIKAYLLKISQFRQLAISEINQNERDLAALKWNMYIAFDSIISLLEMYISFQKFEIPEHYQDTVDILKDHQEIDLYQEKLLRNIIGLRNALSHDYEKLDLSKIKKVIDKHLEEIDQFLDYFAEKIS